MFAGCYKIKEQKVAITLFISVMPNCIFFFVLIFTYNLVGCIVFLYDFRGRLKFVTYYRFDLKRKIIIFKGVSIRLRQIRSRKWTLKCMSSYSQSFTKLFGHCTKITYNKSLKMTK